MPDPITRLTHDLAGDLRALTLTGPRANAALRSALATVLAVLVAFVLHLDNPYWAGISGVVLVQSDRAATVARSIDRIIGTMLGATIGYLGAELAADHLAFLALVGGGTAFTLYAQDRAEHGYAFLLSGITMVLILFGSLATPDKALELAVYRGFEILVGVFAACAVDYALAPPSTLAAVIPKTGIFAPPLDRELAAIAISGGIAIIIIPLVWETLDLPGLSQTPITAFVILVAMRQEPGWRALTRAVGCLFGDPRFNSGPFILSPFDWDSRDIFYTTPDRAISGVIDWDFATIVPVQSFFRYPPFMTRDWIMGTKSTIMENYRRLFRECLGELQDETELPLKELLDQSRWFQMLDEGVQSSELGKQALPVLEAYVAAARNRKVEVKPIPVIKVMPVLRDVASGGKC